MSSISSGWVSAIWIPASTLPSVFCAAKPITTPAIPADARMLVPNCRTGSVQSPASFMTFPVWDHITPSHWRIRPQRSWRASSNRSQRNQVTSMSTSFRTGTDERLRYGHFVWHLFVLAGTSCHFLALLACTAWLGRRNFGRAFRSSEAYFAHRRRNKLTRRGNDTHKHAGESKEPYLSRRNSATRLQGPGLTRGLTLARCTWISTASNDRLSAPLSPAQSLLPKISSKSTDAAVGKPS